MPAYFGAIMAAQERGEWMADASTPPPLRPLVKHAMRVVGAGRPVLFLNGSGATLESTGLLLTPFSSRVDLLAHDQRGLGGTSIPPGPYAMADYASTFATVPLDDVLNAMTQP